MLVLCMLTFSMIKDNPTINYQIGHIFRRSMQVVTRRLQITFNADEFTANSGKDLESERSYKHTFGVCNVLIAGKNPLKQCQFYKASNKGLHTFKVCTYDYFFKQILVTMLMVLMKSREFQKLYWLNGRHFSIGFYIVISSKIKKKVLPKYVKNLSYLQQHMQKMC